jgi:hypothetical protein
MELGRLPLQSTNPHSVAKPTTLLRKCRLCISTATPDIPTISSWPSSVPQENVLTILRRRHNRILLPNQRPSNHPIIHLYTVRLLDASQNIYFFSYCTFVGNGCKSRLHRSLHDCEKGQGQVRREHRDK